MHSLAQLLRYGYALALHRLRLDRTASLIVILVTSTALTQAKRGLGIFVPAYHQTRNETDLLLTGLIPLTRLEVWHEVRWLCPIDPAFAEIMGSRDELDVAVFRRHEKDQIRKARIRALKRKKERAAKAAMSTRVPEIRVETTYLESQSEDEVALPRVIRRRPSVRFVPPSPRKQEMQVSF